MIKRWRVVVVVLGLCWMGACNESPDQPTQAEAPPQEVEPGQTPDLPSPSELPEDVVAEEPPASEEPIGLAPPVELAEPPVVETPALLSFTMTMLDGQDKSLADYNGKVLLIVNTASRCGFTPQYTNLQGLHERYADAGLAVLGFPANSFGNQEPGTDEEIAGFCQANFGVTFDMFSKISVAGDDRHELYDLLTAAGDGPVQWNFEKFLIARDGTVVGHYRSATDPADPALLDAIERELSK